MKREEVIYCLKAQSERYSEVCEECPLYGQTGVDHCCEDALQMAITALQNQPVWIPVSERLPEDYVPVNITWVNHNPDPYYASIKDVPFTATGICYKGKWYWYSVVCEDYLKEYGYYEPDVVDDEIEIKAWMPLPKPYRESEKRMANRNTLHSNKLDAFRKWLIKTGWTIEEPKGIWEVLRAKKAGRQNPLIVYQKMNKEHLSVLDRDIDVIKRFLQEK